VAKSKRSSQGESTSEVATLTPSAEATPGYDVAFETSTPRVAQRAPQGTEPPPSLSTSFESAIAELGAIVEQLERGDLPLEQSLSLFEKGIRLSRTAQARLDAAERRVEELLGFDSAEQPITRRLDTE
jgi:exodeoxyribonuclease VII small subunit